MRTLIFSLAFLCVSFSLIAKVQLPPFFSNNMVLQQQSDAPIWGKATPGKDVKIVASWDNQLYTVKAGKDGTFKAMLKTPEAGGPYDITFNDGKKLILRNVMVGEVWICSGQSNMEMPLAGWGKVTNYEKEIAEANYPDIRLLQVEKATNNQAQLEMKVSKNSWQVCSPTTIAEFSSVAYFFGRNLHQNRKVAIGLINTSWGGTIAQAWASGETLKMMPDFKDAVQQISDSPNKEDEKNNPNRPTVLYNAMINPIVPYTIRGAIWYQGESNAGNAYQYRELFPLMIRDWRKQWHRDFPFYFVQLANFRDIENEPGESEWAELREAQLQTLHLENTGMAVTIDIGDAADIHPKNKQDVGIRLALAARANTYGENIAYSGPAYQSYKIENGKVRISFTHTNGGLKAKDNQPLKGFAIAGPDHQFYWADAVIEGEEVVVSSPLVPFPVSVRYAWADNPMCNLYNGADLPASPFRTDDWRRVSK